MKFPLLLLLTFSPLLLGGCSAAGRALGTASHVLSTGLGAVTRPLATTGLVADPGTGTSTGWQQGIQRVKKEDAAPAR